jgi:RNA polymerase primary sigma factor
MKTSEMKMNGKPNDSVLSMYLRDIKRMSLLNRDDESDLAIRAANGDINARNKIVSANLRFVVNIAKRYQNHGIELEDLISEGNIGLLTAIERFDVSKGYHFISYAVWWIRQSILKCICEKSRMIRLPMNRVNELVRIEQARKLSLGHRSDEEEISEIAGLLNMNSQYVREMLAISRDTISLDASIRASDPNSAPVSEFIEDRRYETPENAVLHSIMKRDIDEILETLTPKEAEVLRRRFGLNGKKAASLRDVGTELNLTKERIRQIEKHAIKRLQNSERTQVLESYVA